MIKTVRKFNYENKESFLQLHCPDTESILGTIRYYGDNFDTVTEQWSEFSQDNDSVEAFCDMLETKFNINCDEITIDFYQP